eukprot:12483989-Prorocentrum_lima.AAC.1
MNSCLWGSLSHENTWCTSKNRPVSFLIAGARCCSTTAGQSLPEHAVPSRRTGGKRDNVPRSAELSSPMLQLAKSPRLAG